jgi:hypothetical protein
MLPTTCQIAFKEWAADGEFQRQLAAVQSAL